MIDLKKQMIQSVRISSPLVFPSLFPLTPALSLGERVSVRADIKMFDVPNASNLTTNSPSPLGRGPG
jgi:hypothetical protein